jgi:hypothetical protein
LSDGSQVIESPTTENSEEVYDIQIQGSDRKYPAIILRRKHRGAGATILTVSKFGQHSALYADYEAAIAGYIARRQQRLANTDNSSDNSEDHGEEPTTRDTGEGSSPAAGDGWIDQALQSVVSRRTTPNEDAD